MKHAFFILLAMGLALPLHAQERSAGQSYDAQVNYGALSAKLDALISQNRIIAGTIDSLNDKVTKVTTCGAKSMFYAPSSTTPAPDADGCVPPAPAAQTVTTDASKQTLTKSRTGTGWVPKSCPDGWVMTGGYWTDSDNWGMYCRPLILQ